jgi:hypothetical protein
MSAQYTISVDPARDLVEITMSGFFTPEDVARFVRARDEAHRKLTCAPNAHLTINDISGMKVQAQEIVGAFQAVLATPSARSRRLAFIVSRTLARMQVVRALNGRDARCFEDRALAETWLFTDPVAEAA